MQGSSSRLCALGAQHGSTPSPRHLLGLLERHAGWVLAGVVSAILLVGAVYSFALGSELRYWDEREYHALATCLVEQGRFEFLDQRAFRPPLYPMLLAALLQCGVPVAGLRFANFVLLAGCAVLLQRLAQRIAGQRAAGVLAAAWVLAYPVLIYLAGTLYPQTLAAFLLLLVLDLVLRRERAGVARAVKGGLGFGLLLLTVPAFVPMLGVLAAWLLWRQGRGALLPAAAMVGAAAAAITPWTVRNHAVLGDLVFITSNSGLNLLLGNSANSQPDLGSAMDRSQYEAQAAQLDELGRDRFYRDAALTWMRDHPGAAARLYAGKLLHHFAWSEQLATPGQGGRGAALLLALTYLPLLGLVAVRLLLARRRPLDPIEYALLALYVAHALATAVFFTRIRFRLPVDTLLLPLAAVTIAVLAAQRRSQRAMPTPAPAVTVLRPARGLDRESASAPRASAQ